ncbi:MAG: DUF4249 family protein [Bacteroidota bacterium]
MKVISLGISILIFILLTIGCQKKLPFPVPDDPKLVVGGLFWTDSLWAVSVVSSESLMTDERTISPIEDASILIRTASGEEVSLSLDPHVYTTYLDRGPGLDTLHYYTSQSSLATPDQTYQLEVIAAGFEMASAEDKVPQSPHVVSASLATPRPIPDDPSQEFVPSRGYPTEIDLTVQLKDPGQEAHFYQILLSRWHIRIDPASGDTLRSLQRIPYMTDDVSAFRVNGSPLVDYIFEDVSFDGLTKSFLLSLKLQIPLEESSGEPIQLTVLSLSPSYYQAIRSFQAGQTGEKEVLNGVIEFFQEPVPTFDNIDGGFGIFGGASRVVRTLHVP